MALYYENYTFRVHRLNKMRRMTKLTMGKIIAINAFFVLLLLYIKFAVDVFFSLLACELSELAQLSHTIATFAIFVCRTHSELINVCQFWKAMQGATQE